MPARNNEENVMGMLNRVWLAAVFTVVVSAVRAEDGRIRFNLPAQPLAAALKTYAQQADIELIYGAELVAGKQSPALAGQYTAREALERLLAGSGLRGDLTAEGAATITAEGTDPPGEPAKATDKTPPNGSDQGATELPEMTVTASPLDETSYNVPTATTATKTDTPIMETPVSIQVVPQQVLKDQQAFRLEQALWNVSGVYTQPVAFGQGAGEIFNLRGFRTLDQYRNGFRYSGIGTLELANLDRIEVLKGPASILYGRIEPGGLINLVTKQPLASPYYLLQQQLGSFDFYRTTLDATGPVAKDHGLFYRFNLAYENAGSFIEFLENERVFIAPTLMGWTPPSPKRHRDVPKWRFEKPLRRRERSP